jgi:hypothetical protein
MKATPEKAAQLLAAAKHRIGMPGYARILSSLLRRPRSTAELAAANKVSHLLILAMMRHCLRAKIVHRSKWIRPCPHSRMVPVWALGEEGDISMPQYEERFRRARRAPSTLILLTTVIDMLKTTSYTRAEIAEELCMRVESAQRIVACLRDNKLIFIESWTTGRGTPAAEWRYGPGKSDVPRPLAYRATRSVLDWHERKKQIRLMHAMAGPAPELEAA